MKPLKYANFSEDFVLSSKQTVTLPSVHLSQFLWQKLSEHEDKQILIDGSSGTTYTGEDVKHLSACVAAQLMDLGLTEGDIVCCFMPDNALYACVIIGIYCSSAVFSGIFTGSEVEYYELLPKRELVAQVTDLQPKVLLCTPALVPYVSNIADSVDSVQMILVVNGPDMTPVEEGQTRGGKQVVSMKWRSKEEITKIQMPREKKVAPEESVVYIPYSSGSTGKPKGVVKTDEAMVFHAISMKAEFEHENRIEISTAGFAHSVGLWYLHFAIASGFPVVLHDGDKYFPKFLELIQNYKCTHAWLSPSELNRLNKLDIYKDYDLSSLMKVVLAAALVPVAVTDEFIRLTGNKIQTSIWYGSTEAGIVTSIPQDVRDMNSLGAPMPGISIRIVEHGTQNVIPHEFAGEIQTKGMNKIFHYYNRPDADAEHIVDGWFATGDKGYIDADGLVHMVGRYKDLIKVHGFQVAPAELEDLLMAHEEIREAAVIGVADEQYLEIPKAFVTLKSPDAEKSLKNILLRVNQEVQYWKKLRAGIEWLPAMPIISIGKINKQALRAHQTVSENVTTDESLEFED